MTRPRHDQGPDYERGFIDGMQHQMQSSVDKAVNRMAQRTWVGLTDEEITELHHEIKVRLMGTYKTEDIYRAIEAKLKQKNGFAEEKNT